MDIDEIDDVLDHWGEACSTWEIEFLESVRDQTYDVTDRQQEILDEIEEKLERLGRRPW